MTHGVEHSDSDHAHPPEIEHELNAVSWIVRVVVASMIGAVITFGTWKTLGYFASGSGHITDRPLREDERPNINVYDGNSWNGLPWVEEEDGKVMVYRDVAEPKVIKVNGLEYGSMLVVIDHEYGHQIRGRIVLLDYRGVTGVAQFELLSTDAMRFKAFLSNGDYVDLTLMAMGSRTHTEKHQKDKPSPARTPRVIRVRS